MRNGHSIQSWWPIAACVLAAPAVQGSDIHVPADQPTIQAAINAAASHDVIILADGTYAGTGNLEVTFGGKALRLISASGDPNMCIIDCGAQAKRAMALSSGDSGVEVKDIRITNMGSDGFTVGAVQISNCSPHFTNCIIDGCQFGGMQISDGSPSINRCLFRNNNWVTALSISGGTPQITECTFTGNTQSGGAEIYNGNTAVVATFENCRFFNNTGANPGALFVLSGLTNLVGCSFYGNTGGWAGAVEVFNNGAYCTMINCTLANNHTQHYGAIRVVVGGTVDILNCIFWNNDEASWTGEGAQIGIDGVGATVHLNNSTVMNLAGTYGGVNNLGTDPNFADLANNDFHLTSGSSAIDSGNGSYVGGCLAIDLGGHARIQDDPNSTNLFNSPIDRGAYEFGNTLSGKSDCNGNGIDDACDLTNGSTDCDVNNVPDECQDSTAAPLTQQPGDASSCAGGQVSLTFAVNATSYTIQWYHNGQAFTPASGQNTTITFDPVTTQDAGTYYAVIDNGCTPVTTNTATVTVTPALAIDSQPGNAEACIGEDVTLTVAATGATGFQWRKGGTDLPGEIAATLSLGGIAADQAGSYDCVITGACGGPLTTTPVTVTITTPKTWYRDADGNGLGDPNDAVVACTQPTGYVATAGSHVAPIANAGADATVTVVDSSKPGPVTLDASDSTGDIVLFEWYEGDALLGTGSVLVVNLGVGVHTIKLVVTDSEGATATDEKLVTVALQAQPGGGSTDTTDPNAGTGGTGGETGTTGDTADTSGTGDLGSNDVITNCGGQCGAGALGFFPLTMFGLMGLKRRR